MKLYESIKFRIEWAKYREIKRIRNKKKDIYYIIRRKPPGEGFFSNYFYVLSHIIYAEKKGWISVVDMKNYPTLYTEDTVVDEKNNGWEYYFRQPEGISIEQAYNSHNYVLSENKYHDEAGVPVYAINQGHITSEMVGLLYHIQKEKIPINSAIYRDAKEMFKEYVNNKKCIGIHIRGTDMKVVRNLHSLPPSVQRSQRELDILLERDKDSLIFLCCDEEQIVDVFKKKYGDKVFTTQAFRANRNLDIGIHRQASERINHKYLLGREVLIDCLMLSMCNNLICGVSNVTNAAVLFNNGKYENVVLLK